MKSQIRGALERWSRGKTFSRCLHVNGNRSKIFVSPDAQLKYLKSGRKALDQDLIEVAERFVSDKNTVWDIGANVGVFTFASAMVAPHGTVVAIEADTWLVEILRRTAHLPGFRDIDIRIVPVAVAREAAIATLHVANRGRASNSLAIAGGHTQTGGIREVQFVPTVSLDLLADSLPSPDFIKVDVEGAELLMLQGATSTLKNVRPVFYMEILQKLRKPVMELISGFQYDAYDARSAERAGEFPDNVLLVPREKPIPGMQSLARLV